jgi:CubicO group peptidase (beta-lactamase class C family)
VTLRDLLCHRLGTQTFQGDFTFWASTLSRSEVVAKMATLKPQYDFRTRFGYCNAAFLTAGEVLPKVVPGSTWEDLVRQRIFKPLGMTRGLALASEMNRATNAARAHAWYDSRLQLLPYPAIDNLAPAGAISLSINDMTHWLMMQMDTGRYAGKQVIAPKAILKTWDANTIVNPRSGYTYGLGWFVSYPDGHKMIEHTGGVDGFLSASAFFPEQRLGVCVLTNTDNNALFSSVRDQLLQEYLGKSGPNHIAQGTAGWLEGDQSEAKRLQDLRVKVAAQSALPRETLLSFTGNYTHPVYGDVEVRLDNNQLRLYLSHHPNGTGTLAYAGDHTFLCTYATPTFGIHPLRFSLSKKGEVEKMVLKVNDFLEYGEYEFSRK